MAHALSCSICDGNHLTKVCSFPQEMNRCIRCQLPVFDQRQHHCNELYAAKSFFTDIIAKETFSLFRFTFGGPIHILDDNNAFKEARNGQVMICGATDGMFTINSVENFTSVTYSATSVKKFSFIFVILRGNTWRLWLRAVVSKQYGLQLFNLEDRFVPISLPPEFKLNTTAVFGIFSHVDTAQIKIGFAVYAKSVGNEDDIFGGDGGIVEWPRNRDEVILLKPIFKFC